MRTKNNKNYIVLFGLLYDKDKDVVITKPYF